MNFTKFDVVILFTMSLAIVLLSFIFPAVGMADASNETSTGEVPEFNISSSKWDIAGDFPDRKKRSSTPTTGTLVFEQNRSEGGFSKSAWMYGDESDGWKLSLVNNGTDSDTILRSKLEYYFSGNVQLAFYDPDPGEFNDSHPFEPTEINSADGNWSIEMTLQEYDNNDTANFYGEVDYEIFNQPEVDGTSWISRIPIVGGIFDVTDQIAGVLVWIGSVGWWFVATLFEVGITGVSILLTTMIYAVSMGGWLTASYTSVIAAASGWASVILLIPAVLLFLEFAKLTMIGISLFPYT